MAAFNKSDAGMLRTAYELSAGMLSLVVAVGLGFWLGRRLDAWLGTGPWMTLAFLGLGVVAGILNVYRTVTRALDATRRAGRPPSNRG